MSDQGDLIERLRDESLQLARRSFDSADAGISANLCDEAIDELERLRAAKTAALKIADERAKEAVELRAKLESAQQEIAKVDELVGIEENETLSQRIDRLVNLYVGLQRQLASARKALEDARNSIAFGCNTIMRRSAAVAAIDAALTDEKGNTHAGS